MTSDTAAPKAKTLVRADYLLSQQIDCFSHMNNNNVSDVYYQ